MYESPLNKFVAQANREIPYQVGKGDYIIAARKARIKELMNEAGLDIEDEYKRYWGG